MSAGVVPVSDAWGNGAGGFVEGLAADLCPPRPRPPRVLRRRGRC